MEYRVKEDHERMGTGGKASEHTGRIMGTYACQ